MALARTSALLRSAIGAFLLLVVIGCSDSSDSGNANGGATAATPDITVASLNALHGLFCAPETEDCRVADRLDLLFDWLEASDCPDVVLLQEILGANIITLLDERAAVRCDGIYQVLSPDLVLGQNFTLTRYPVLQTGEDELVGGIRNLFHVQVDHPPGPVDIFTTHFAAGIDLAPCDASCPEECQAAGASNTRECQAIQVIGHIRERAAPGSLRILGGDFNAEPDSSVYRFFVEEDGWVDAFPAAGNAECDPSTGAGCTSGRESENLSDMESPRQRRRQAYRLPPAAIARCRQPRFMPIRARLTAGRRRRRIRHAHLRRRPQSLRRQLRPLAGSDLLALRPRGHAGGR